MDITLTDQQNKAFNLIKDFIKSPNKVFILSGYAGTGKSTIISKIFEEITDKKIGVISFTGKSVSILTNKGIPAMTIHHFCYEVKKVKEKNIEFKLLDIPVKKCDVVIVDEASMVDKEMLSDLLKFPHKLIFVGDPFQLPPIGEDPLLFQSSDFTLTEIIRQNNDSGILNLSMRIRNQEELKEETSSDYIVRELNSMPKDELVHELLNTDQILTVLNDMRVKLNNNIRKLYKRESELPEVGDKLILTKNLWYIKSEQSLVNGLVGTCKYIQPTSYPYGRLGFLPKDYENQVLLDTDLSNFYKEKFDNTPKSYRTARFDFAYAITVWKYQGSESDNIVAILPKNIKWVDKYRLYYTAITRAKKKLTILLY